jgi:para-aminobenzoate synthetase component I
MRTGLPVAGLVGWVEPGDAFAALTDEPRAFWLDDPRGTSWVGIGGDVVGSLADIRTALAGGGSLVGWVGYEARAETMAEPVTRPERFPRVALMRVEGVLRFDHAGRRVVSHGDPLDLGSLIPAPAVPPLPEATATWADSDADYLTAIQQCLHSIRAGEAYQLCLTTEARVDGPVDVEAAYRRLRAATPSHHGGLIRVDGVTLASASPERFLRIADGHAETSPIKGTRPRSADPTADARLALELLESAKERAENTMIVDLMRNDLARVAVPGSVVVDALHAVESYPAVHQLVSTVSGRLRSDVDLVDVLHAVFPAGSMTGAPKLAATRILDGLERRTRGVYAGAFGWLDGEGDADLAMVIRSIVADAAGAVVGSGGGITASSVPEEELAEVKLKAAAPLAALGVAGGMPPVR